MTIRITDKSTYEECLQARFEMESPDNFEKGLQSLALRSPLVYRFLEFYQRRQIGWNKMLLMLITELVSQNASLTENAMVDLDARLQSLADRTAAEFHNDP